MGKVKESVDSLYILKCICAVLVVFIHLPALSYEGIVLQPLMRIGVPSFLLISGYFLFREGTLQRPVIERQLRKLIKMMGVVYASYLSFSLIDRYCRGESLVPDGWTDISFWLRLLVVGDGVDTVLWYLTSYGEALVLLYALACCKRQLAVGRVLGRVSPVLLLLAVLLNRYSFLIRPEAFDVAWSRNALLVALPCLLIGGGMRKVVESVSVRFSIVLLFLCVGLGYVEYALLHHYGVKGSGADFNLMTFPIALSAFLFCLKHPSFRFLPSGIRHALRQVGKYHSGHLYLYHCLAYYLLMLLAFYGLPLQWMLNAETVIVLVILFSVGRASLCQSVPSKM